MMQGSRRTLNNPQLLEISTRPYLYLKGYLSIRDIPDSEFENWKKEGFDWIWFMGIWTLGSYGINHDRTERSRTASYDSALPGWTPEDVIGSPYAITKYEINPAIGTEADLIWLRNKLHTFKLKLMVDFVPNHSAWDATETQTNEEFYIRCPNKKPLDPSVFRPNRIAYGRGYRTDTPWTDAAQLNYFDSGLRAHQTMVLDYIASIADGARCDLAHLVLNENFYSCWKQELDSWGYSKPASEFWTSAISSVKNSHSDFIFVAEVYGEQNISSLISCGFDYAYDKWALDMLYRHDISGFKQVFAERSNEFISHLLHFTENHDEPRSISQFWGWQPAANAVAAALLTLPGIRFFNYGQSEGFKAKLDVHLRRATIEAPDEKVREFYQKLFEILRMPAIKSGEFSIPKVTGDENIIAWKWSNVSSHILVAVNFGDGKQSARIEIDDVSSEQQMVEVKELIEGVDYLRDSTEMRAPGLCVILDSYQIQIFEY